MTVLRVIFGILLVLFLLGLIRVGGSAEYSQEGFQAWVFIGLLRFQIFPVKKKKDADAEKKQAKKDKKKPAEDGPEEGQKKGGSLALVRAFLPLIGEAARALKRRIRIDRLLLDYTAGGADAAGAAMAFGGSSAAIGTILPVFQNSFDLKEYRVRTGVDFNAKSPVIYVNAALSARIGQLVSFACIYGWKAFQIYRKEQKLKKRQKEAN